MSAPIRPAMSGDVFIVLFPTQDALRDLRHYQQELQKKYGGRIYVQPHVTCQRFSPGKEGSLDRIITEMCHLLATVQGFPLLAHSLIQIYAPFWQTYMIRWRIERTRAWEDFSGVVTNVIQDLGIEPHYQTSLDPTCTALSVDAPVDLQEEGTAADQKKLFRAQDLVISKLKGSKEFEMLAQIQLSPD